MKKQANKFQDTIKVINIYTWASIILWTLLIISFFVRDIESLRKATYSIIEKEAVTQFNFDEAFRKWTALHGGFYVPITPNTQPSPYLKKIKNRDIVTLSGDSLTLINPARALRMMSEYYENVYHIKSHITSTNLLRPKNKPDRWEQKALGKFENGSKEEKEIVVLNGDTVFRLMRPLYVDKNCLKCHKQQGYKEGDLRGGISITIPLNKYLANEINTESNKKIIYSVMWLIGVIGIFVVLRILRKKNLQIIHAQEALQKTNVQLEHRVKERMAELEKTNKELIKEIGERKHAEATRKISEERYKGIVHSTASCIAVYEAVNDGENFKFVEFNPMAEKAEKIKKEEVLGRLVTDVFPGVIEFGLFRVFQNVYKTGKPQHFPIKVYKDNRIKGYRENYVYKLSSGEIVAVYQDVTERKRAEQIQKILYNISNAVTETDNLRDLIRRVKKEVGKIIDTTNFYIALYDEKTDRLNIPFYHDEKDTITSAPADKTLSKMVIELNQPLLVDDTMKENLIKTGKLIILGSRSKVWLGVPLKIEGKAIGVVAVQNYRDQNAYTESDKEIFEFIADQISVSVYRKKIEEDLRNALMKAEESDRLKSAFLANMSHEIRTPMNGIMGFASLLKEPDLTGEEIRNYTDIIIKSGERMLNIINNLIDISKIEAGQISLTLSDCNINEQLNYLQMFFYPEAKKKNLNLTYTTEFTDDESVIITDSEKLYAILSNLIKNSLKFTHKGSIEFGYRKKSGFLEFYVKDTGIGIPKNRQEAIFDRFVQADIEDKEVYEGAGLGLSITKAFVELLGGEIWLESVVDQGTCFYFTIPLKKANGTSVKETKKAEKTEKESIVNKFMFGDLKVMIAEDESVSDQYLTAVISEITGNIFHARTGKEAVEIFKKNPDIDLILMDIKMPVMNGYEATKEIRKLSKEVVIIGQTAYAMFGDREKVINAGCNEYITKPVDKEELTELINSYFNKE